MHSFHFSIFRSLVRRELRDQLRDRRTLFLVLGMPLLLYPLLGFFMFKQTELQISGQSSAPYRVSVLTSGDPNRLATLLQWIPPSKVLILSQPTPANETRLAEETKRLETGECDAVWFFPASFVVQTNERLLQAMTYAPTTDVISSTDSTADERNTENIRDMEESFQGDSPVIYWTTAIQRSMLARQMLENFWNDWNTAYRTRRLEAASVPDSLSEAVAMADVDVAMWRKLRGAAIWSQILPLMLILFVMTGAFHAATDVCTGDRERGTLETLLTSPATRLEIVVARLVAVTIPAMLTAFSNLCSILICVAVAIQKLPIFEYPPLVGIVAILVTAIPLAIFFSAISIAIATFARNTREAQLYLTPLLMIVLPLILFPMLTSVSLTWQTAMIPLSGLVLWLQQMISGNFSQSWSMLLPVTLVTLACIWLAILAAVTLFRQESILFRTADTVTFRTLWAGLTARQDTRPRWSLAVLAGVGVIVAMQLVGFLVPENWATSWNGLITQTAVTMLLLAVLALLMGRTTANMREALSLRSCSWWTLLSGVGLAILFHPAIQTLGQWVEWAYPLAPEVQTALEGVEQILASGPVWVTLFVITVMPGVCEELLFRGAILSGLRRLGPVTAIVGSSLLFGAAHTVMQQSMVVTVIGVVPGLLVLRTGSLFPAMLFHMTNNLLAVVLPHWNATLTETLQRPMIVVVSFTLGVILCGTLCKKRTE